MKKSCYLLLILLQLSFSMKSQQSTIVVIPEKNTEKLRFWPLDGKHLNFYILGDSLNAGNDGTFHIRYTVEEPVVLNILTDNKLLFFTYLTKGSCDTLRIIGDQPVFSGTNNRYNQCLSEIKKTETYCNQFSYTRNHELERIESLSEYQQKTSEKRDSLLVFLQGEKLSSEFTKNQKLLINCMFTHLFYRKVFSLYNKQKLTEEWLEETQKQLKFDFREREKFQYAQYKQMLELHTLVDYFILNGHSPKEITREGFCTFLFEEYKKKLTGESLEFGWASLLFNDIYQRDFSESIPMLYEQFCSQFPQSKFTQMLEPGVEEVRRFHEKPATSAEITIYPADSTFANIEEAVKAFKGKVVYVDLWATWCGPCQKMFAHGNAMKKATKDMDIVYLYISIDRPENRHKWEKMIHFYDLKGYHMLGNKELVQTFYNSLGNQGMLSIPQFVIIGKDGKVAIEKAAAPNELEKVTEQLKQINNE